MKNQLQLNLHSGTHGGRRPNSGRKRIHSPGVSHHGREEIKPCYPLHINFKYNTYIQSDAVFQAFLKALENARKHHLRILCYSMQSNHIHLIVEVDSTNNLITSMRSLTNTIIKYISNLKNLSGTIQVERYHLHILKTQNETSNAFHYVAYNEKRHTGHLRKDKFSSINGYVEMDKPKSWLARKAMETLD